MRLGVSASYLKHLRQKAGKIPSDIGCPLREIRCSIIPNGVVVGTYDHGGRVHFFSVALATKSEMNRERNAVDRMQCHLQHPWSSVKNISVALNGASSMANCCLGFLYLLDFNVQDETSGDHRRIAMRVFYLTSATRAGRSLFHGQVAISIVHPRECPCFGTPSSSKIQATARGLLTAGATRMY